MKRIIPLILFSVSILFYSCSTGQKVTNSWVNKDAATGQKYTKIFIAAMTDNQAAKKVIENDLAYAAVNEGFEAIKGSDVFTQKFSGSPPSKEELLNKIKELNCDAVFTVSLLDSKTESRYVPGNVVYEPYPRYSYYHGFGRYYTYWAPTVYSPGYYTNDKTYYIEGNLFDVNSEDILWSVQSESYNPSNLEHFSKNYSKLVVSQLYKDGLLQKK